MRGMRIQENAWNTSCFGSSCVALQFFEKNASQVLPEARESLKVPFFMFGAVPVNLRSGHDGFAQVTLANVARHWHKQVVHSGGWQRRRSRLRHIPVSRDEDTAPNPLMNKVKTCCSFFNQTDIYAIFCCACVCALAFVHRVIHSFCG